MTFEEIKEKLNNAGSYEDIENIISLIKDPKLRTQMQEFTNECEWENQDIKLVCIVLIEKFLDPKIDNNQLNELKETKKKSDFDKLSDKISKEYIKKGMSKSKAEEIGNATAAKIARSKKTESEESNKEFTLEDVDKVAEELNLTFDKFTKEELLTGMNIELEHGTKFPETNVTDDDLIMTAKIALAHLNEYSNYYDEDVGLHNFERELEAALSNKEDKVEENKKITESDESILRLAKNSIVNGKLPEEIKYKGKTYKQFYVIDPDNSGETSDIYYCNMENIPSGDPQESNDYFYLKVALNKTKNGYKGIKEIRFAEDLTESKELKESPQQVPGTKIKGKNNEEKLDEGTDLKRIARYNEFDNGYVLFDYKKMTDEEAEQKAKEASEKDPYDVYYVEYDDVMNPRSDLSWINGISYNIDEYNFTRSKEKDENDKYPMIAKKDIRFAEDLTESKELKESVISDMKKKGLYDYIVNEYYNMDKDKLADIAKEAVYILYNEDKDLIKTYKENLKKYTDIEDDIIEAADDHYMDYLSAHYSELSKSDLKDFAKEALALIMDNNLVDEYIEDLKNNTVWAVDEDDLEESKEVTESDEKFSGVEFEKNIPHVMRYKQYDVSENENGETLYWVTQQFFTLEELKQFQKAFISELANDKFGFTEAYVTVRDLSTYDLKEDYENGVLCYITKYDLDYEGYEEFCKEYNFDLNKGWLEESKEVTDNNRKIKIGSKVYWIGAGNEISAEGEVIDFPVDGRMTIKWDDNEQNTYDITHPNIILADNYDNSVNESEESKKITESNEVEKNPYENIKVYMNTWGNYNEYGADAESIKGGWMTPDEALEWLDKQEIQEEEPFINDVDGKLPFEVDEYSNPKQVLEQIKDLQSLSEDEAKALSAIMESQNDNYEMCKEILDSGDYIFFPDVSDDDELGHAYVDMVGVMGVSNPEKYINQNEIEEEIRNSLEDSETEYSDEMISELAEEEIENNKNNEEYLDNHFDYEALGRDLDMDGYYFADTGAIYVM